MTNAFFRPPPVATAATAGRHRRKTLDCPSAVTSTLPPLHSADTFCVEQIWDRELAEPCIVEMDMWAALALAQPRYCHQSPAYVRTHSSTILCCFIMTNGSLQKSLLLLANWLDSYPPFWHGLTCHKYDMLRVWRDYLEHTICENKYDNSSYVVPARTRPGTSPLWIHCRYMKILRQRINLWWGRRSLSWHWQIRNQRTNIILNKLYCYTTSVQVCRSSVENCFMGLGRIRRSI